MDEFDDYLYKVKKDVIRKLDACKEGNFRYECTIIYTFVVTKNFLEITFGETALKLFSYKYLQIQRNNWS